MNKPNISKIGQSMKLSLAKHSPAILMGFGIAGMVTAGILAVKETPKALKLIEEKKSEEQTNKLTPVETIKTTWKCYAPAVVTVSVSIACLVGSSKVNSRRNAALATAYKLSETALAEYREKVIETIGEKKEQTVRESIAKDKLDQDPVSKKEVIVVAKGSTLCYDAISGRYFKSDIDSLKKAENELNRRMRNENYISLNEFYSEIGLKPLYPLGDDLGWNIDKGYIDIHFSSQLADDGTPCVVVEFNLAPRYGYSHFE